MVKVITDRGLFEITESLFNAIKINNPSLLENRISEKQKRYGTKKSVKSNVQQQIIDDSAEKNGTLSSDLNSKVSSEVKKENDKNNEINDEINNDTLNDINKTNNLKKINSRLINMLNDSELKEQIKEVEQISFNIIGRVKKLIQNYSGIAGSNTAPTKSEFNDEKINQLPEKDKNKFINPLNAKNNTYKDGTIKKFATSSGMDRKISSELKLALGGFKLSPYFGKDTYNGKALKYYKSATKKSNNSKIDDMIQLLIDIKNKVYVLSEEERKYYPKFENMVYNFLHNTVYRLEVNNDKNYNNILSIVRNDPALRDLFDIDFNNTTQQFDTKENIISYRNKHDNIIDALIIATPMFYQGKEIFKNLSKIGDYGKQLKA